MKRRSTGAGTIAALMLACVFGVTLLLSLVTGAGVYRRVQERVDRGSARRVGLSYVTAKIHGCDESGCVRAGRFGGSDAVILSEEIGGTVYDTVLYVYDGKLMEVLFERGEDVGPENGQGITPARELTVSETEEGLLRLSFTGGSGETEHADVYLRSGG